MANEAKHTPGPWKIEPDRSMDRCEAYISSDLADDAEGEWSQFAVVIVRMLGDDADDPAGIANAKLIAAAPALADALAEYVAEVDRDGLPSAEWSDANLERMRAALRKAGRLP